MLKRWSLVVVSEVKRCPIRMINDRRLWMPEANHLCDAIIKFWGCFRKFHLTWSHQRLNTCFLTRSSLPVEFCPKPNLTMIWAVRLVLLTLRNQCRKVIQIFHYRNMQQPAPTLGHLGSAVKAWVQSDTWRTSLFYASGSTRPLSQKGLGNWSVASSNSLGMQHVGPVHSIEATFTPLWSTFFTPHSIWDHLVLPFTTFSGRMACSKCATTIRSRSESECWSLIGPFVVFLSSKSSFSPVVLRLSQARDRGGTPYITASLRNHSRIRRTCTSF